MCINVFRGIHASLICQLFIVLISYKVQIQTTSHAANMLPVRFLNVSHVFTEAMPPVVK